MFFPAVEKPVSISGIIVENIITAKKTSLFEI